MMPWWFLYMYCLNVCEQGLSQQQETLCVWRFLSRTERLIIRDNTEHGSGTATRLMSSQFIWNRKLSGNINTLNSQQAKKRCTKLNVYELISTFHSSRSSPMMTSSNGNIFPVTDAVCGEFTGHRWIPRTKASDAELWCFLWSAP